MASIESRLLAEELWLPLKFNPSLTLAPSRPVCTAPISNFIRELQFSLAILFVFVFTSNGSGSLFEQYASKALNWPIVTTSYAYSTHALAALDVLVVLAGVSRSQRRKPLPDVSVVWAGEALLAQGAGLAGFEGSRKSGGDVGCG
ncbi:hypothetical protein MFIFM68171_09961 [Madurella fahalii]|uniref:Uncharacterized protein n=1 Tax=Madurella fahalii TaxID=1157608 RepID=A0ABQ0GPV4_9PEZI